MASALVVGGPQRPAGNREPPQALEELNATRAAVSLPLEIIVLIFSNLLSISPPRRLDARVELGWIGVTHVCHRWRQAAISAAILWTRISDLGPEWTRVSLQRAGSAPLRLDRYEAGSNTSPAVEDIACRLGQMRILPILGSHEILRPLLDRLHGPAPRLEYLDVEIRDEGQAQDHPISEVHGVLLNGGGGPLHHLKLTNVFFQWNSFNFSGLVRLSLSYKEHTLYTNMEETRLPSLLSVLATIRDTPNLEHLHLANAVHAFNSEEFRHSLTPVSLPNLKRLIIEQNKAVCAALIRNVVLKLKANVSICCIESTIPAWETDADIRVLLSFLASHVLPVGPDECNYDCDFDCNGDHCLDLCYQFNILPEPYGDIEIYTRTHGAEREAGYLSMRGVIANDLLAPIKTMFSTLPRERLTIVEMRNEAEMSADVWTEIFLTTGLHWPNVHGVLLEPDGNCSFLVALLGLNADAIPSLKEVVLDAEPGLPLELLDEVESRIVHARERGVPLERITLRTAPESEGVEQWKDMLAAVVPMFRYDAETGPGDGFYAWHIGGIFYVDEDEDDDSEGEEEGEEDEGEDEEDENENA
ncbi:hypothetical protein DENSPDRAFT_835821 [Dentipellis sp. KUC8613]|nr:hypothetical protein DENSPDRAFT_835821 [Dentipellis sp. KUC8613]